MAFISKQLFKNFGHEKASVTFDQFRTIMYQVTPEISDLDISQLFRSSRLYGNGKINFDSFFLAANETDFLIDIN